MIAYDIVALLGSLNNLGSNFNIYDLVNEEGYIGLRGLFRLKKNGVVERAFQLKKIKLLSIMVSLPPKSMQIYWSL